MDSRKIPVDDTFARQVSSQLPEVFMFARVRLPGTRVKTSAPSVRSMRALAALGVVVALGLSGCSAAEPSTETQSEGSSEMSQVSADEADVAFAQMMIPHHAQAIVMADVAIEQAESDSLVSLARAIKDAQTPEIALMSDWLVEWGAEVPDADSDIDHSGHDMGSMMGDGMMSDEDLDQLGNMMGTEFDSMWLAMMIAHHEGAIAMSEQVLQTSSNEDVRALANAIIDGQTSEIEVMKAMLAE